MPARMTKGHIPGSLNLPYELLVDPHTGLMHTKDELLECETISLWTDPIHMGIHDRDWSLVLHL